MSERLTDAEIDMLAAQWWRQHDKPLEPFPEPLKLVPYNELPEAGAGSILAAAMRSEIVERGYSDGAFELALGAKHLCMNCGTLKRAVEDGWCDSCAKA